jgi:hypothetical protein
MIQPALANMSRLAKRVNPATGSYYCKICRLYNTWRFQYFKQFGERLPHKCQVSLYNLGALSKATSLSSRCVQHVSFFHGVQNLYAPVSSEGLDLWYRPFIHCSFSAKLSTINHAHKHANAMKYRFSQSILVENCISIWIRDD